MEIGRDERNVVQTLPCRPLTTDACIGHSKTSEEVTRGGLTDSLAVRVWLRDDVHVISSRATVNAG